MEVELLRTNGNEYLISRNYMFLSYISGLKNNTFYILSFNDMELSFYSNNQGILYFSDKFQNIPVSCIPYDDMRIKAWRPIDEITTAPVGHYSNTPRYTYPCDKINLTFTLTEFHAITQTIKSVQRDFIVQNGSIDLPPVTYSDKHVGVI
jgi:hypothetical protein